MTNQTKIVLVSITVIMATGLMGLNPSILGNAQAQMYANDYGYDNNYYQDDNRYSYDNNHQKKSSDVNIQKIKCINSNINVNGIDITQIPQDNTALAAANEGVDATGAQNGNGWGDRINFERNLVNICVNVNVNEQVKVSPPEEEPEPPTCEECFTNTLDEAQLDDLFPIIFGGQIFNNPEQLCSLLETLTSIQQKQQAYTFIFISLDNTASITDDERDAIIDCLLELGLIIEPPP